MRIVRLATAILLGLLVLDARAQACPFPPPVLLSPADGATAVRTPVAFSWTASAGAIQYEVWASFNGGPDEKLETTTDLRLFDDVPPRSSIQWYVVANFTQCSIRSATARFTTAGCDPPLAELLSPAPDSSSGSPVTFSWQEVEDADAYRLWITPAGGASWVAAETGRTTVRLPIAPGAYAWSVETIFTDCGSSRSETRQFEVRRSANCSGAAATLLAPVAGATAADPRITFSWTPVPQAVGYRVLVSLEDGDFEVVGETAATSMTIRLSPGRLRWKVVSQFDGCDDTASPSSSFAISYDAACDRSAPLLLAPANDAGDVPAIVNFVWTAVDGAVRYDVYVAGEEGEGAPVLVGSSTTTRLKTAVPDGELAWFVEATLNGCPSVVSPRFTFDAVEPEVCRVPAAPEIHLDPRAGGGEEYLVLWSAMLNTSLYELQEATREDFSDAVTRVVDDILLPFAHEVVAPTRYYYRVRAVSSCGLGTGPYSNPISITVANGSEDAGEVELASAYGAQRDLVRKVHIAGAPAARPFVASTDKPWMRVVPSSGTVPPEGLDVTVTADPRALAIGSTTGTLIIGAPAAGRVTTAGTTTQVPFSVNLVTPVTPSPGTSPLPSSLIIPAVAHVDGLGGRFESDIRLANTSPQTAKYLLAFTPTRSDGTTSGRQVTVQVPAGQTLALNDILKNVYGFAAGNDSVSGMLEIRPLGAEGSPFSISKTAAVTFASSRTYATSESGTYGQFIPAIPYSELVSLGGGKLSLQQLAQSALYRTNLGLVEAAGLPVTVQLSIFGDDGQRLRDFLVDLRPGEHMQLGSFLALNGINVTNGRAEVTVASGSGKVTAYASVLDNRTNDPMLVLPVDPARVEATRYILPGVANFGNWRSDIRIFNAATGPATATLTYYRLGDPNPVREAALVLEPGRVFPIDDVLRSLFDVRDSGGSIVIATPSASSLIVTGRTYDQTERGTYGQFIPAVTEADGIGRGDRALQILQVEESDRFRTNAGIIELTGKAVTVEIGVFTPDSKIATYTRLPLQGSELRQLNGILRSMGFPVTYNARLTLKVVEGEGKIHGYASLVDNRTNDGTYVPAQ